jgi:hypothetical protein
MQSSVSHVYFYKEVSFLTNPIRQYSENGKVTGYGELADQSLLPVAA